MSPACRRGFTLIEACTAVGMTALFCAVVGPPFIQLVQALRDEPLRLAELRMAGVLMERIGRDVRCAEALPASAEGGFVRDDSTLLVARDGVVRVYRLIPPPGQGIEVVELAGGRESGRDTFALPLAGRFAHDVAGGRGASVRLQWRLVGKRHLRAEEFTAVFSMRAEGGVP